MLDGHHLLEELLAGQGWVERKGNLKVRNTGKRRDRGDDVRGHQWVAPGTGLWQERGLGESDGSGPNRSRSRRQRVARERHLWPDSARHARTGQLSGRLVVPHPRVGSLLELMVSQGAGYLSVLAFGGATRAAGTWMSSASSASVGRRAARGTTRRWCVECGVMISSDMTPHPVLQFPV